MLGKNEYNAAFIAGIGLNSIYVVVEFLFGLKINSSALIADAGHNITDVIALALAWLANRLAQRQATERFSFGFRKTTILASVINSTLILVASVFILIDAIHKIQLQSPVQGNVMMIVAGIGIIVNSGTALFFYKGHHKDLNIKGAFLHMAADAAVSIGVLLGGLIIKYTQAFWIDPVLSFMIVGVIFYSAWDLLIQSVKLSLDAVPEGISLEEVKNFLNNLDGVEEVHDLHIWALSTTETALSAHLVVPSGSSDEFIFRIREMLEEKFHIHHTTLQLESGFSDEEYRKHKM